jgi:hypothetical protein
VPFFTSSDGALEDIFICSTWRLCGWAQNSPCDIERNTLSFGLHSISVHLVSKLVYIYTSIRPIFQESSSYQASIGKPSLCVRTPTHCKRSQSESLSTLFNRLYHTSAHNTFGDAQDLSFFFCSDRITCKHAEGRRFDFDRRLFSSKKIIVLLRACMGANTVVHSRKTHANT